MICAADMKLLVLVVVLMAIGTASCLMPVQVRYEPTNRHPVGVEVTRGTASGVDTKWESLLVELQRQDQTSMEAWMQMPIRIDGTIPLWGVVTVLGAGVVTWLLAFFALRSDVRNLTTRADIHEKTDKDNHDELLREIARINDRF